MQFESLVTRNILCQIPGIWIIQIIFYDLLVIYITHSRFKY
jgi:hypothetical protein